MAITLDAQLLEILACPSPDHAPLRPGTPEDAGADALTCTECGRVYPVRDGIPVLLLEEAVFSGDHTPGEPDDSRADSA
ncbi:Trm112 family protein [Amycolatopsis sp. NPDC051903]|uniref:Trm112 family protein n=1 Tax=Amycolatopsis sp. NPDC051903 TaxID=3363936 RepID=UPI0037A3FBA4